MRFVAYTNRHLRSGDGICRGGGCRRDWWVARRKPAYLAPVESAVRFTAVIVTWNSATQVRRLIESFHQHVGEGGALLFVDNASDDNTVETIRSVAPASRVIELPTNAGSGTACNVGIRAAATEVIALLDPDTELVDGSLCVLATLALEQRALLGPRLLNPDGSPQISARPLPASWESLLLALCPGPLMPAMLRKRCEPWRYAERLSTGWSSAACLVAQRDLLLELGPFDERIFVYGDDLELGFRARKAGVPIVLAGDVARVVHRGGSAGPAFAELATHERRIEAYLRLTRERLGPRRGALDLAVNLLGHGSRWSVKRLLRRDADVHAAWLRAGVRALRSSDSSGWAG